MATNPVQSASYRVHIENLAFNVSRVALTDYRKDAGKYTGLCSAIFAVGSKNALLHCVQQLGAAQYRDISWMLGPGQTTMNAKEAYYIGAKRLIRPESSHSPSEASDVTFSVFFAF